MKCLFFGDSIFNGEGIAVHKTFVHKLAEEFYPKITIMNSSLNGDTTRTALSRMAYNVKDKGYNLLFIQFGLNDCNIWDTEGVVRVSPTAYVANIEEMVYRGLEYGCSHIFVCTNHLTAKNMSYDERVEDYNSYLIDWRWKNPLLKVTLIDIAAKYKACKDNLNNIILDDGIHLSEEGHNFYYNQLRTNFYKFLEIKETR